MKTTAKNSTSSNNYRNPETQRTLSFAESFSFKLRHLQGTSSISVGNGHALLGLASFYFCKKTRLNFCRRNHEVKRSETALVSDKSENVVFKDIKWSLDFFGSFWVKPKTNRNKTIQQL